MPENAAAAPSSARTTCASVSQSSSWPGFTSSRTPSWLAIEPRRREQRRLVPEQLGDPPLERGDGRVLAEDVVADRRPRPWPPRIAAVGRVTVSLRRSITPPTLRRPRPKSVSGGATVAHL